MKMPDSAMRIGRVDLAATIAKNSRISIVAACFSVFAYQGLRDQLEKLKPVRFTFTSLALFREKAAKRQREFYFPRLTRERSLHGSEFEVKLKNELIQKAVTRKCIRESVDKATETCNITPATCNGMPNT